MSIPFSYSFFDIMWRKLWLDRRLSAATSALYFFGIAINVIVLVPFWIVLLAVPFWIRERRKHPPASFCSCGYDLRGGHMGGRCPECGAAATPTR